jgi:small ligand-binding sensory domain FIST
VSAVRVGVGVSTSSDTAAAAREAALVAREGLAGGGADLAFLFLSPEHCAAADVALRAVEGALAPAALAGASTEAVIGDGHELENRSAASVLAASLPGARARVFHLSARPAGEGAVELVAPADFAPRPGAPIVLLADPYTFPVDPFLRELRGFFGGALAVGGLASGGSAPGEHVLLCDGKAHRQGAVAVELDGDVRLDVLVSQGCAPVGPDLVVTAAEGSVLSELAGAPAYERLVEVVSGLDPESAGLARTGVLLGIVIDENQAEYGRGDYLIRAVIGGDSATGALVVGEPVRVGQTVRFHVRDARSADADLRSALRQHAPGVHGGLLFACNGRGTRMYPEPDHDAGCAAQELGGVPVAGMFCAGEIGPVGGQTFLHGFTATMALLVSAAGPAAPAP